MNGILDDQYSAERKTQLELQFRVKVRAGAMVQSIRRFALKTSGLTILDLGSAEGRTLIQVDKLLPGNTYTGVEYSRQLIDAAPPLPDNISLIRGDLSIQFPDSIAPASIDIVSALAVLEHLANPLNTLKQAYRVLKPGGLFIATCPEPAWDHLSVRLGLLKEDQHVMEMNKQTLTNMIVDAGFDLLDFRRFMWAPIAFLPYLNISISASLSLRIDRWIESFKVLNWLFVNQAVISRKPV